MRTGLLRLAEALVIYLDGHGFEGSKRFWQAPHAGCTFFCFLGLTSMCMKSDRLPCKTSPNGILKKWDISSDCSVFLFFEEKKKCGDIKCPVREPRKRISGNMGILLWHIFSKNEIIPWDSRSIALFAAVKAETEINDDNIWFRRWCPYYSGSPCPHFFMSS